MSENEQSIQHEEDPIGEPKESVVKKFAGYFRKNFSSVQQHLAAFSQQML